MASSGPGTKGTRHISKRYPADDGIIAGSTSQEGHKTHLQVEDESLVRKEFKKGL